MAEATLSAVLHEYITRRNNLTLEMTNLRDQKNLSVASRADAQVLLSARKTECRNYWEKVFNEDPSLQDKYSDYTEIPGFEEDIDRIQTEIQEEIDRLTAWEGQIDSQLLVDDTELKEIEAYMESYKEMLSGNISDDFEFGGN